MSRKTLDAVPKLVGFGALLGLVFGAALLAGGALDPQRAGGEGTVLVGHGGRGVAAEAGHGGGSGAYTGGAADGGADAHAGRAPDGGADAHAGGAGEHAAAPDAVRGLATSADGLRLVVERAELRRGAAERLRFRVVGTGGASLRAFDRVHERRMHLIVVRRDLTGFQHLHPTMTADGTWSTSVVLPRAGSYRLFADFTHDRAATTLAGELRVDGAADLRPLPAPVGAATSDGGDAVTLAGADSAAGAGDAGGDGAAGVRAGVETTLSFAISRDGAPVALEPYLGADGHLVALREGDLAFLHVHPSGAGPAFATTFPTPGRYRLFLQYKVAGGVRTVAFTVEVAR